MIGEKASGNFLIDQSRLVAFDVLRSGGPGLGTLADRRSTRKVIPTIIGFLKQRRFITDVKGRVIVNRPESEHVIFESSTTDNAG
jgi:hypothetical protein